MNWTIDSLRKHLFETRKGKTFNEWHHFIMVNRIQLCIDSGLEEKEFGQAIEAASMDVFNDLKNLHFPVETPSYQIPKPLLVEERTEHIL